MSNDLIPNVITGGCVFRTEHKDLAPLSTSLLDELPLVDWAPGPLVPPHFRSPVQHQIRLSPMIPKRDRLHPFICVTPKYGCRLQGISGRTGCCEHPGWPPTTLARRSGGVPAFSPSVSES